MQATSATIRFASRRADEKLMARRTMAGGVAYTNRPTQEPPLPYASAYRSRPYRSGGRGACGQALPLPWSTPTTQPTG